MDHRGGLLGHVDDDGHVTLQQAVGSVGKLPHDGLGGLQNGALHGGAGDIDLHQGGGLAALLLELTQQLELARRGGGGGGGGIGGGGGLGAGGGVVGGELHAQGGGGVLRGGDGREGVVKVVAHGGGQVLRGHQAGFDGEYLGFHVALGVDPFPAAGLPVVPGKLGGLGGRQRRAVGHGDGAAEQRGLQPGLVDGLHDGGNEPLLVGAPAVALFQRAGSDAAVADAFEVIGQAVVGDAPSRCDALQSGFDERAKDFVGVLGLMRHKADAGGQGVVGAGLAGGDGGASAVVVAERGGAVGRLEKAVVIGAIFCGQQRRQLEVGQVVQAEHAGGHPGVAAHLVGALAFKHVQQLGAGHAHALAAGVHAVVRVGGKQVQRHRAAVGIELDTHHHAVAVGALGGVVVGVDAVHINQLQGDAVGVAGVGTADDAQHKFTIAGQAADQGFAQVAQRLPAGDVADAAPVGPGGLYCRIGQAVGFAGGVFHAGLQPDAAGADDVVFAHADKLGGVIVVFGQVAATGAQPGEVGAQLFIQAGLSRQPVGGQAVNAGAGKLAHKHRGGGAADDAGQALAGALQ